MQIITANLDWIFLLLFFLGLLIVAMIFLSKPISRYIMKRISDHVTEIMLTDEYSKNIMELLPSLTRFSVLTYWN